MPLPEIFAYWLQGGRIDVGFLGAAQIDRFGNLNSTVIGDYARPKTRLPGAGGAPEIATHAKQMFVVLKQSAALLRAEAGLPQQHRLPRRRRERGPAPAPPGPARRSSSPTSAC